MLLRSSSTPVLGSLLLSFSDSPSHHLSEPHPTLKHPTPPTHHHHVKPLLPLNCSSSPRTRSAVETSGSSLERSTSEGNLIGLAANTKSSPMKSTGSVLETIPSFSFHNATGCENEDADDEEEDFGNFGNSYSGVETSDDMGFLNACKSLAFLEEQADNAEMYLARGLGVENLNIGFIGGGGGGGDFVPVAYGSSGGGGKRQGAEEHYKNLVEENPGNPLFLRNYAEFLYESKRDLAKSEELYSRAILADPGDGEVLSQYAKLIWELHHDQDRALSYYERAVHAAPADSHVHASYANFLWDIEDEAEDDSVHSSSVFKPNFYNEIYKPLLYASARAKSS